MIFGTVYVNINHRTKMTKSNRTTFDDVIKTVIVFVEGDCTPNSYPSLESDESCTSSILVVCEVFNIFFDVTGLSITSSSTCCFVFR